MLKAAPVLRLKRDCELVKAVLSDRTSTGVRAVLSDCTPAGGIKLGVKVRPVIDKDDRDNVHTSNTESKCQQRQKESITDWRRCTNTETC